LFCIPIYIWLLLLLQEIQNISISKLKIGSIFVGKLGKANLSRENLLYMGITFGSTDNVNSSQKGEPIVCGGSPFGQTLLCK
jgi:hypothetical protein